MGLREEKKERTRRAILERAEALFRERGFDETRVRDVIGPLGISEPTFFNYFPSKQSVLDALALVQLRRDTSALANAAKPDGERPLLAGLADAYRPTLRAMQEDRDYVRLLFTRSSLWNPSGSMRGMHAERGHPLHESTRAGFRALAALVAAAQQRGEIRPEVDPERLAEVAFGVFRTTTTLWLTGYWDGDDDLETRLRDAFALLWAGVSPSDKATRAH